MSPRSPLLWLVLSIVAGVAVHVIVARLERSSEALPT